MSTLELIATTAFGLEAVVARELQQLGYTDQSVEDGRVTFRGDELAICRANLWLRSADRVLVKIAEFPALDFDHLFDQTKAIAWNEWLPIDARFPVSGKSVRSRLHNPPAIQSVVKKAIVESLKQHTQRHWFAESGVEYPIEISMLRDRATLTLDTSGAGLHKRGYRKEMGPAPLRETLAAALIQLSYWNRDRPLVDPFCGTGTIAVEAALIARNRAPGMTRNFLSEDWHRLPQPLWKQAREEARDLQVPRRPFRILGFDIDPRAVEMSRTHARVAGVEGDMNFEVRDVLEFKDSREYGVIITNPPYGERLGDRESAEAIYDDMADAFHPLETWSIYVLTSHPGFERFYRKRADRRRKLYNGKIECHYYQYYGPRPPEGYTQPPDDDLPRYEELTTKFE